MSSRARHAPPSTPTSSRCRSPPGAQAMPVRPRDFRLTAADAARLRPEPEAANARLTGVMTDLPATSPMPPTTRPLSRRSPTIRSPRPSGPRLRSSSRPAARAPPSGPTSSACVRRPGRCRPRLRPIDYTLTRGQAARCDRTHGDVWSQRRGRLAMRFTRQVAVGLTALGLVGLLVSSAPSMLNLQFGAGATASAAGEAPPAIEAAPAPGAGGLTDTTGQTDQGARRRGHVPARQRPNAQAAERAPGGGTTAARLGASTAGRPAERSGRGAAPADRQGPGGRTASPVSRLDLTDRAGLGGQPAADRLGRTPARRSGVVRSFAGELAASAPDHPKRAPAMGSRTLRGYT